MMKTDVVIVLAVLMLLVLPLSLPNIRAQDNGTIIIISSNPSGTTTLDGRTLDTYQIDVYRGNDPNNLGEHLGSFKGTRDAFPDNYGNPDDPIVEGDRYDENHEAPLGKYFGSRNPNDHIPGDRDWIQLGDNRTQEGRYTIDNPYGDTRTGINIHPLGTQMNGCIGIVGTSNRTNMSEFTKFYDAVNTDNALVDGNVRVIIQDRYDSDSDENPDSQDNDDDNDGFIDSDNDGLEGPDNNNDGVEDFEEGRDDDHDNDGIPDNEDDNDDNDGDELPECRGFIAENEPFERYIPFMFTGSVDDLQFRFYCVFFEHDIAHTGDIEGVLVVKHRAEESLLAVYTQHAKFMLKKHSHTPNTISAYFWKETHAAYPEEEVSFWEETVETAEVSALCALASAMSYDVYARDRHDTDIDWRTKNTIEPKDWESYEIKDAPMILRELYNKVRNAYGPGLRPKAVEETRLQVVDLLADGKHNKNALNRLRALVNEVTIFDSKKTSINTFLQSIKEGWGGIDFTSVHLAYISEHSDEEQEEPLLDFQYVLRATEAKPGDEIIDLEEAETLSLLWFLIGLSLPDDNFWVNLNPWESDRIIDEDVGRTDVGRIMLEADFQMKKDFCKYQNPCESDIGEEYWSLLEGKREELVKNCMNMYPGEIEDINNVLFAATTRHWIVPDMITAYGDDDEFYIADATLTIYSEPVFEHSTFEIVNQDSISEDCSECLSEATKEYGRYAKELEEEMILPLVVEEVNTDSKYSNLRQVYASLALAQWYKSHYSFGDHLFSDLIDSENLENLESMVAWSPEEIWTEYVKSYKEGEFHCEKEYEEGNYIITEIYSAGGVEFQNIEEVTSIVGPINSEINEMVSETMNKPLVKRNEGYYFGDYISGSYDLKEDTSSPIEPIIEEYFEPIINTIKSIIEKYFVLIIIAIIIMGVLVFVVVVSTRKRKKA